MRASKKKTSSISVPVTIGQKIEPSVTATNLDDQIRNTTKNMAIVLIKVHNLQVDMAALRSDFQKVSEAIFTLLHDSQAINHAEVSRLDAVVSNPNSTRKKV